MMTTTQLGGDTISYVCKLVCDRSAIELDETKTYLIEARLSPLAKRAGCATVHDYLLQVKGSERRADVDSIVEAMTTNETSFFRDLHPFEALRESIVPELMERRRNQRSLRIWSAACSTGQELYSTAMMLRENFPELGNWDLNLVGTDLSDEVLRRAQEGVYSQIEVNRGLPAKLLAKYFQHDGLCWKLHSDIMAQATFKKLNLIEHWVGMPKMDIVFLRNVLIYFSTDVKRQILEKVRQVMNPDGVLFLGAAETTLNLDLSFVREQYNNSVFYRVG